MTINIGPITDALNALGSSLDSVRAAMERDAQDAADLQAAQDRKAASDQDLIAAKSVCIAALDQYESLVAQFVQVTKTSLA